MTGFNTHISDWKRLISKQLFISNTMKYYKIIDRLGNGVNIRKSRIVVVAVFFCWTNKKGSCPLQQQKTKKWWIDSKTTWHSGIKLICFTCILYLTFISKIYLASVLNCSHLQWTFSKELFLFPISFAFLLMILRKDSCINCRKFYGHIQFNNKLCCRIKIVRNFSIS